MEMGDDDITDPDPQGLRVAEALCVEAAHNHGLLLPPATAATLKLLTEKGIVRQYPSGETVLLQSCLEYGIACANPVLECTTRSESTILEVEQSMISQGWELVDKHKEASVHNRRAVRNNFQTYYDLLLNYPNLVDDLECAGNFHHKQSDRYYQAVMQGLISRPGDFVVYAYKTADYYDRAMAFLQGQVQSGPLWICQNYVSVQCIFLIHHWTPSGKSDADPNDHEDKPRRKRKRRQRQKLQYDSPAKTCSL